MKHLFLTHIHRVRPSQIRAAIKQIKDVLADANVSIDVHGYVKLFKGNNKNLFALLRDSCFFDFHCTNNGHVVGMHQIVKFIYCGYKFFLKGFLCPSGKIEVHHLDSNPSNNHHSNLWYVTPQENKLCSELTRGKYLGKVLNAEIGAFKQDSPKLRLAQLLKRTWEATFKVSGKDVIHFLLNLPKHIGKQIIHSWRFL